MNLSDTSVVNTLLFLLGLKPYPFFPVSPSPSWDKCFFFLFVCRLHDSFTTHPGGNFPGMGKEMKIKALTIRLKLLFFKEDPQMGT